LQSDLKSEQFLPYGKLIAWLTQELNNFYSIGEYVQNINCNIQLRRNFIIFFFNLAVNDISNFLLELGGFLRDYGCPYRNLIDNENRLNDRLSRVQLLGTFFFLSYNFYYENNCF